MCLEGFIGLRPKCYSLLFNSEVKGNQILHTNSMEKQTAKITTECVKKLHLRHVNYKETLINHSTVNVKQDAVKTKSHTIVTYHQTETSLTAFDTKEWICEYNVHTIAHGHIKTRVECDIDWDDDIEDMI